MDNILIVAERENSSMVSSWTEYLCLQKGTEKSFRIFTGMYEGLADSSDYYNEDTGDYDLPEQIGGKTVVKVDDDIVVGGELGFFEPDDMVEFNSLSEFEFTKWLDNSRWSKMPNIKLKLNDALTNIKSSK